MSYVEVNASRFRASYAYINGSSRERISTLDVCRAAITVGASDSLDLFAYGWRYLRTQLLQGLMARLFVIANRDELVTSSAFTNKVQTEKGTATYWLGMAFTKLVAERKLKVPWLCHVDRLIDQGVLTLTHGTSERGDLAGKDHQNAWHVLEAKGRSYNVSSTIINQAKSQASRVVSIKGQSPSTASACIVRLYTRPITIDLIDPEPEPYSETVWEIEESRFFPAYYASFLRYIREHDTKTTHVSNLEFKVAQAEFLGPNIWIGLPSLIIDNPANALNVSNILYERANMGQSDPEISIGYDGVLISNSLRMEVS